MTALLLQVVPAPLTVEQEISAHPYLVALLITLLFSAFVALAKLFLVQFERRINEKFRASEKHDREQDERLDAIEGEIRRYDAHVAVGTAETRSIHDAVSRVEASVASHIEREETTTWAKIDSLAESVGALKTGQEVMSTRLAAVEKKLPNGELTRLAEAFTALAEQRGPRRRKV